VDFIFGKKEGQSAQNMISESDALKAAKLQQALGGSPAVQNALSAYSSGKTSLADALASLKGERYVKDQKSYDWGKSVADIFGQIQGDTNLRGNALFDNTRLKDGSLLRDKFGEGLINTWKNEGKSAADILAEHQRIMDGAQGNTYDDRAHEIETLMAVDPTTATRYAVEKLQSEDPFFNKGVESYNRAADQESKYYANADADREALSGKGDYWSLNNQDFEAYGQAKDDLARMFGSQEASLAQALADRGLAEAPSGAAVQAFSGLQGNKFEQLANAQRKIVADRVNTARDMLTQRANLNSQLLGQTQSHMRGLGELGENAIANQFNRQLGAQNQAHSQQMSVIGADQQQQQLAQQQANEAFSQQQQTQQSSLFENALAGGIGSFIGGYGGGLGAAMGRKAGGSAAPDAGTGATTGSTFAGTGGGTGQLSGYNYNQNIFASQSAPKAGISPTRAGNGQLSRLL